MLISLPVAWMVANKWLQNFAYRIELSWWMMALAGFIAIFVAVITVSTRAIKAAVVNPAKSLKME